MKSIQIRIAIIAFLSVFTLGAQEKLEKTSKTINTSSDVTIDLNTSYTDIEIDTWDSNKVQVEAYIESSELSKKELEEILDEWDVSISGSGDRVSISTRGGSNYGSWTVAHINEEVMDALKDLKIEIADFPENTGTAKAVSMFTFSNKEARPESTNTSCICVETGIRTSF